MAININFKNSIDGHKHQEKLWQEQSRFIDILAGRRGGKNWIADRLAIKRIYQDLANNKGNKYSSLDKRVPRLHYWYVAPTYEMTRIFQKEIFTFLAENNAMALVQKDLTNSKSQLWLYPEILIEFKSADNPQRLVGSGLNGIRITETARLKPNVWNDNLRPTLSDKQGWAILDTTPLGYNWYAKEIREVAMQSADWACYHWNTCDNDKVQGLIDEVNQAKLNMPEKYFKRNYEASLDAFFGQVYEEFTKNVHIQDFDFNPDDYDYIRVGVDWGYAHNGAMVVGGFRKDGSIDIIDEIAEPRLLVYHETGDCWAKRGRQLVERYQVDSFYCGVDQPESIELLTLSGLDALPADNDVKQGIFTVSNLLHIDNNGKSLMRINPRCEKLIKGLSSYKYKPMKDGQDSEEVEKMADDEVDSLRYLLYSNKHLLPTLTNFE
jgi:hypothetical protein